MTDSPPAGQELKPCPHCNGQARPWQNPDNLYWLIECTKCHATAGDHVERAEAAAAWNRRAPAQEGRADDLLPLQRYTIDFHTRKISTDTFGNWARADQALELIAAAKQGPAGGGERKCTCHPDDNPPRPCPRKYALQDCRAAAQSVPLTPALREAMKETAKIARDQADLYERCWGPLGHDGNRNQEKWRAHAAELDRAAQGEK